ncbi:hypothetical protein IC006_1466 [Sulfuracidifex tepidarius]|uniref:PDZ domain-containing protein n=1 Tax=Sulfuracidifex tepidarius TaxID=1294262 RepID=A0A510DVA8_9CREN|nr:PDZ domain-containing protein [Sulfuracidifex tepidarius]BBG24162.1 hypothetical protein IC006_1466 [Sulfuracidifex tepidarius]
MYFKVTPAHRYVKVEANGREGEVTFPTWLPGSYVIREMERNIVFIDGIRISKNKFWVRENFSYKVYTMSWDQREAISTGNYMFLNGPAVFPFQSFDERYCIELNLPEGWKANTTLRKEGERTLCARDYHELADSSIQASPDLKEYKIDELHKISTVDVLDEEFLNKLRLVVSKEDEVFSAVDPLLSSREYIFYFRFSSNPRGGIEHSNSSAITSSWNSELTSLVEVFAHEYFHRLNVKYLKPKDLKLNYEMETYTELLWFAEGVTDYMAYKLSWKSGGIKLQDFLKRIAESLQKLTFRGGMMSLAESSMTAWIKYYRRDENYLNSAVSYYDGGLILGLILDLSLFRKGLRIEDQFRKIPREYTLYDLQEAFSEAEVDLEVSRLPSREMLKLVRNFIDVDTPDRDRPYLGISLDGDVVSFVEDDSPADQAGVCPRDKVLSVNGRPAEAILKEIEKGKQVHLLLSRDGRLQEIGVVVGKSPGHGIRISGKDVSTKWAGEEFKFEVPSRVI